MRHCIVVLLAAALAAGCAETRPGAEPIGWFTNHWICDGCGGSTTAIMPVPPPPLPPHLPPDDTPYTPSRLRGG